VLTNENVIMLRSSDILLTIKCTTFQTLWEVMYIHRTVENKLLLFLQVKCEACVTKSRQTVHMNS